MTHTLKTLFENERSKEPVDFFTWRRCKSGLYHSTDKRYCLRVVEGTTTLNGATWTVTRLSNPKKILAEAVGLEAAKKAAEEIEHLNLRDFCKHMHELFMSVPSLRKLITKPDPELDQYLRQHEPPKRKR